MESLKTNKNGKLDKISELLTHVTNDSEELLMIQQEKADSIIQLLQKIYKVSISNDALRTQEVLESLVVAEMDEDQIWQQIELRNDEFLVRALMDAKKLSQYKEHLLEINLNENIDYNGNGRLASEGEEDEESEHNENEKGMDLDDEEEMELEEDLSGEPKKASKTKKASKKDYKKSVVDDDFFKLNEMEEFLLAEEAKEKRKEHGESVGDIDYFAEDNESDANVNYKDFFDEEASEKEEKPSLRDSDESDLSDENDPEDMASSSKPKNFANSEEMDEEEENENDNESDNSSEEMESNDKQQSSFEITQARLSNIMREYESRTLGEKPWQMLGEVHGAKRPKNSLLEELLEFDPTVRPAPVVTKKTTQCLETIIKQRIKDKAWDDVVRVAKRAPNLMDYKKSLVLDQQKPKESLAEIYEKQYQKEVENLKPGDDNALEEIPLINKEIKKLMKNLFVKLDSLSNFHFTPQYFAPEVKIVTNTPAIETEEVAPSATSHTTTFAPEELLRKTRHELVGKTEKIAVDKKRATRKRKNKQRALSNKVSTGAKDQPNLKQNMKNAKPANMKHRNVKMANVDGDQKSLKSSKAFFSKLQDRTIK